MGRLYKYLFWEGIPWIGAVLVMVILYFSGSANGLRFLFSATVPTAEMLRLRLISDIVISQLLASLLLCLLRYLWPYAVVRQPWPFIRNCIIDPLLGAVVLTLLSYGWAILAVGPGAIELLEAGKHLAPEMLPLFY